MDIIVEFEGEEALGQKRIQSDEPITFSEVMNRLGIIFSKPCGGALKCYRCGIRFSYGAPAITDSDEAAFSAEQLENGMRLGCCCVIKRDCRIVVPSFLVGEIKSLTVEEVGETEDELLADALAVDIGTTTIAVAAVNSTTGKIIKQQSEVNPQLEYGSDVMTRIRAAMTGQKESLHQKIYGRVKALAEQMLGDDYRKCPIAVSANTTMVHFLMNYPVDKMAGYPFEPYELAVHDPALFSESGYIFPAVSAFVGGDIVSGLYYLGDRFSTGTNLFVDFGTNAEIVLYHDGTYHVTSTSCGPALEGGNISCGVAAVSGAISHVKIMNGLCITETSGGAAPVGICGSGVVDLVSELRRNGIIAGDGLLQQRYHQMGYEVSSGIYFTNEDIEQVLLAKSAILSGIQTLCYRAGIDISEIDNLYAAGGFGAGILPESAAGIGLIPKALQSRYVSVGNTSLAGAVKLLNNPQEQSYVLEIIEHCVQYELANDEMFKEKFIENLCL